MKWAVLSAVISASGYIAAFQSDLIPATIWEQIPVILIFGGIMLYLIRLYFQDQDRQRINRTEERKEERVAHLQAMSELREAQAALLKAMLAANKEMFEMNAKIQAEALEDGMDKIAGQYYRLEKHLDEIK